MQTKNLTFFIILKISFVYMSNLKCIQKIIFLEDNFEAICISTCFINDQIIGNSSCLAVRTAFLITLALKTEGFQNMNLVNVTTFTRKTTYLRVFINYYFRGVMLRALIAKKWSSLSQVHSILECWLEGQNSGGSITITAGKQKFVLQLKSGMVVTRWKTTGKDTNKTLEILNQKFNYDCYFVSMICPQLSDEIYQRKIINPDFTLMRNETIHKRFLRKTWKSSWISWFKYKELEELSASYGTGNIIYLDDYENVLDITQSTTATSLVFLVGGATMVLFLLCCLSIVTRRKVSKETGRSR
ncbi:envelope glycoprotein UL37 [macacine betaherpesvirus 9]|uniref:Envelope glycoprotein UL37 n=1 Tax=macacine betaherpesvirus 9 TaxID=2560568 RepID=A0A191S3V2_9BETA|nr:envelope glycoprotein UL37 [macacine betaherpesvirus 9]ANC96569.1 envelope glycoprotein UL37 [macacine betaherpesvirus 9]